MDTIEHYLQIYEKTLRRIIEPINKDMRALFPEENYSFDIVLKENKESADMFEFRTKMGKDEIYERLKSFANEYFNVEITDKSREKNLVKARQMFVFICYNILDFEITELALKIGFKDHSTAIHNRDKFIDFFEVERIYRNEALDFIKQIRINKVIPFNFDFEYDNQFKIKTK